MLIKTVTLTRFCSRSVYSLVLIAATAVLGCTTETELPDLECGQVLDGSSIFVASVSPTDLYKTGGEAILIVMDSEPVVGDLGLWPNGEDEDEDVDPRTTISNIFGGRMLSIGSEGMNYHIAFEIEPGAETLAFDLDGYLWANSSEGSVSDSDTDTPTNYTVCPVHRRVEIKL